MRFTLSKGVQQRGKPAQTTTSIKVKKARFLCRTEFLDSRQKHTGMTKANSGNQTSSLNKMHCCVTSQ